MAEDHSETKIAWWLRLKGPMANIPPRWNGAPTQDFGVLRRAPETGERALSLMRWGLVPSWSKEEKPAFKTINARAESVATSPAYRGAWKAGRRCVIPVEGFYEWKKLSDRKQPYLITMADRALMALGGLWETKQLEGGEVLRTFTIITVPPNTAMEAIHDRMPLVLGREDVPQWLGDAQVTDMQIAALMHPCPDDWLKAVPVDPRMGNAKNWQEEFCRPIEE